MNTKRRYIKFELPEDEHQRFEQYLLATGQTKTEVLRELLRSLPVDWKIDKLPEGWFESEFSGKIKGTYWGCEVHLYPDSRGYEVLVNGMNLGFVETGVAAEAVAMAKQTIDEMERPLKLA